MFWGIWNTFKLWDQRKSWKLWSASNFQPDRCEFQRHDFLRSEVMDKILFLPQLPRHNYWTCSAFEKIVEALCLCLKPLLVKMNGAFSFSPMSYNIVKIKKGTFNGAGMWFRRGERSFILPSLAQTLLFYMLIWSCGQFLKNMLLNSQEAFKGIIRKGNWKISNHLILRGWWWSYLCIYYYH